VKLNTRRRALARIPYAKIRRRDSWRKMNALLGGWLVTLPEAAQIEPKEWDALCAHTTITRTGLPTVYWRTMDSSAPSGGRSDFLPPISFKTSAPRWAPCRHSVIPGLSSEMK
jgi:hypothetical protein